MVILVRDEASIHMLRMDQTKFFNLCSLLRSRSLLIDMDYIVIEEQLAMFLHILEHNQQNRTIGQSFIRSGETISRHFHMSYVQLGIEG